MIQRRVNKFYEVIQSSKGYIQRLFQRERIMCQILLLSNIVKKKQVKQLFEEYEEYKFFAALNSTDILDENEINIGDMIENIQDIPVLHNGNNIEKFLHPLQSLMNWIYACDRFDEMDVNNYMTLLKEYYTIMEHRWDKHRVNALNKDMINNPPPNTLVLVSDFKQNIVIGRSQIEVSNAFRQCRQPRTVVGSCVVSQAGRYYVNHLSDCLSHKCLLCPYMRQLFNTDGLIIM